MAHRKVVVILPCYNGEEYVETAIQSVLDQTYDNIELIAIDDGSTDNTNEILASISDSRFSYIENSENLGIPKSRNKGISQSDSEYIAFIDQDDVWDAHKIEKQVDHIRRKDEVGVVFSDIQYIDEGGDFIGLEKTGPIPDENVLKKLYMSDVFWPQVTKLVKRDALKSINYLDDFYFGADDHDMDLSILGQTDYFYSYMPYPLVYKRRHSENTSDNYMQLMTDELYLADKHASNPELKEMRKQKVANIFLNGALSALENRDGNEAKEFMVESLKLDPLNYAGYALLPALLPILNEEKYAKMLRSCDNMFRPIRNISDALKNHNQD